MKIHLRTYSILVIFLSIYLSSCVSKKKYVALQKEVSVFETEKACYRILNDSLTKVLADRESTIDSLSYKLNGAIAKREKEKDKARIAANTAGKSTLTKAQEVEKKSLFIYNFTKHVEWPIEFNGIQFVIGVAGDEKTVKDLAEFMAQKKVWGKKIIVEKYKKGARYNLVYITSQGASNFKAIKNATRKSKTLLVSDEPIDGTHISFLLDEDKVRYFVNKLAIEKSGLKVGQELIRYAG